MYAYLPFSYFLRNKTERGTVAKNIMKKNVNTLFLNVLTYTDTYITGSFRATVA